LNVGRLSVWRALIHPRTEFSPEPLQCFWDHLRSKFPSPFWHRPGPASAQQSRRVHALKPSTAPFSSIEMRRTWFKDPGTGRMTIPQARFAKAAGSRRTRKQSTWTYYALLIEVPLDREARAPHHSTTRNPRILAQGFQLSLETGGCSKTVVVLCSNRVKTSTRPRIIEFVAR